MEIAHRIFTQATTTVGRLGTDRSIELRGTETAPPGRGSLQSNQDPRRTGINTGFTAIEKHVKMDKARVETVEEDREVVKVLAVTSDGE